MFLALQSLLLMKNKGQSYSIVYFKSEAELITRNHGLLKKPVLGLILLDKVCNRVACFSLRVYVCFCLLALQMQSMTFIFLSGSQEYRNLLMIIIGEVDQSAPLWLETAHNTNVSKTLVRD